MIHPPCIFPRPIKCQVQPSASSPSNIDINTTDSFTKVPPLGSHKSNIRQCYAEDGWGLKITNPVTTMIKNAGQASPHRSPTRGSSHLPKADQGIYPSILWLAANKHGSGPDTP